MAWTQFLLGRPGFEIAFDVNPDSFDPVFERVGSDNYTLNGDLKERVIRAFRPTVTLKSNWFPKAQLDAISSLLTISDTFLSFITRNDWNILCEPNIALTTNTVQIQQSSMTKLSAIYAAGGYGTTPTYGTISITGVYANPNGSGTNYYTGGSYADSSRTITLGSSLPGVQQVYVSYTYPGWLVRLKQMKALITGGRVDLFTYDYMLDGC